MAIFALTAIVRFADALRPINQNLWRESDVGSVARNYVREGMNLFYPRIDWRGNTPGFAEMEFPVYPWLIAVSYQIFGVHDQEGRIINFVFSLLALWFFIRLAREFLDGFGLVIATAFFAFNPLSIELSTGLKPEGLMLLAYIAAVYYFYRWLRTASNRDLTLACIATALALLAKATAGHIGLFFGVLLLSKLGFKAIQNWRIWLFGLVSLAPALLWYRHARSFWLEYGNSLGVSNETHLIGKDFFTNPYFISGILKQELVFVWSLFGAAIAIFVLWKYGKEPVVRFAKSWFFAVFVLYVVICRTSADDWAHYYHIFSVPPAALLIGFGSSKLYEMVPSIKTDIKARLNLGRTGMAFMLVLLFVMTFAMQAKSIRSIILNDRVDDKNLTSARQIAAAMTKPGLILASGGECFDADGYPVAYNASYMFYWLDRKGFNICTEEQSVAKVREFAKKGAVYFVAEKERMDKKPGFENALKKSFPEVAEAEKVLVFDLSQSK